MASGGAGHVIPPFKERLREALDSESLPVALGRSLPQLSERRDAAFRARDFKGGQADLGGRRRAALERMPELVEEFTTAAEAVGTVVHGPTDAADAVATVLQVLHDHDVQMVVKSKSMATEEIQLNPALEGDGIEVVETDLGEFLVQVAGERPSHIIAPALHITRERAAELISKATGEDLPPDPDVLVGAAARHLRSRFIDAGAGITGANALVAETGTVMLVSNEGNARLASALPPVHIVIAGIDKLVPSLADATTMLESLPRSATGQPISTYVSFISGPSRSADIELSLSLGVHGPRHVHIVLAGQRARSYSRQPADARCASVRALRRLLERLPGLPAGGRARDGAHLHGANRAAGDAVPPRPGPRGGAAVAVRRLRGLRERVPGGHSDSGPDPGRSRAGSGGGSFQQRLEAARTWRPGRRTAAGARGAPGREGALVAGAGGTAAGFAAEAAAAAARAGAAVSGPHRRFASPNPQAATRVAYFPGCLTDWLSPDTGEAAVAVLESLGVAVEPIQFPSCCGLPAINAGYTDQAARMMRQTVEAIEQLDVDAVVSTSTSCAGAMLHDYARLTEGDPEWSERVAAAAAKVRDFTSFVAEQGLSDEMRGGASGVVTIHDACQSKHGLGLGPETRELLTDAGYTVVEAPPSGECCGFGGSFSFDHPEVAGRMRARKLEAFAATGAETVCADNPGCLLHLKEGPVVHGAGRVVHLAELLKASIG